MEPLEIVKLYLKGIVKNDFENLPLHDHLRHESPYGVIEGKRAFIEACKTMVADTSDILIKKELVQGDKICVAYDAVTPSRHFSITEWFTIEGDKISSIQAFFDSSEYNR